MNHDTYIEDIEALPNFGGWQDMDDASNWVDDWENDIHHIDQVTNNASESIDLLQQLN